MTDAYERVPLDKMEVIGLPGEERLIYQCPCGDFFDISLGDLILGGRVAVCPSCSLEIVIVDASRDDVMRLAALIAD